MIIALVQYKDIYWDKKKTIEEMTKIYESLVNLDGLIKKYSLSGESGLGGVYVWESREKAEVFFNENWAPTMKKMIGATPELTYYDVHVVIDNERQMVTFDGKPLESRKATNALS